MKSFIAAVVLAGSSMAAGEAIACSPRQPAFVFFELNSESVDENQYKKTIMTSWEAPESYKRCKKFTIHGYADAFEALTPDVRIDLARAEAIKRLLVNSGVGESDVEVIGRMGAASFVKTAPGAQEAQNRHASAGWTWRPGRWRCDPASEQRPNSAACQGKFSRCYLELADGSPCNFFDVPDPTPEKYSVDGDGKRLN